MAGKIGVNLNDPDFFYCERLKCRLRKSICIKRQGADGKFDWKFKKSAHLSCQNCEQGKAIAHDIENKAPNLPNEPDTSMGVCADMDKNKIVVKTDKKRVETKQCSECGELFERLDGDTDKLWENKKYCSDECRGASKRRLSRESYYRNKKAKETKKPPATTPKKAKKPALTLKKKTPSPTATTLLIKTLEIHGSRLPDDPVFCEYLRLAYELGRAT